MQILPVHCWCDYLVSWFISSVWPWKIPCAFQLCVTGPEASCSTVHSCSLVEAAENGDITILNFNAGTVESSHLVTQCLKYYYILFLTKNKEKKNTTQKILLFDFLIYCFLTETSLLC